MKIFGADKLRAHHYYSNALTKTNCLSSIAKIDVIKYKILPDIKGKCGFTWRRKKNYLKID